MISTQSLIVMLLMILAPFVLYALFFLIKCTPNPFGRGGSAFGPGEAPESGAGADVDNERNNMEMIMKSDLGKDNDAESECPVCLSVFKEGEELKQIKICKHYFHQSCIDTWLESHFNCPVCRAFVSKKGRSKSKEERENQRARRDLHRDDLWQGLPDATGLV